MDFKKFKMSDYYLDKQLIRGDESFLVSFFRKQHEAQSQLIIVQMLKWPKYRIDVIQKQLRKR